MKRTILPRFAARVALTAWMQAPATTTPLTIMSWNVYSKSGFCKRKSRMRNRARLMRDLTVPVFTLVISLIS